MVLQGVVDTPARSALESPRARPPWRTDGNDWAVAASGVVRGISANTPSMGIGRMPPPNPRVAYLTTSPESRFRFMPEPVQILRSLLLVVYIGTLVAVAVYGFHRYVLVYLYLKHRNRVYQPKAT